MQSNSVPAIASSRANSNLSQPQVQTAGAMTENTPLLAPPLDIPLPKERTPTFAPEELRHRQLAALTNWVIAGARTQPAVLAFEDLHLLLPVPVGRHYPRFGRREQRVRHRGVPRLLTVPGSPWRCAGRSASFAVTPRSTC